MRTDFVYCLDARQLTFQRRLATPREAIRLREAMAKAAAVLNVYEHNMDGVRDVLNVALGWMKAEPGSAEAQECEHYERVVDRHLRLEEARDRRMETNIGE